MYFLLAFFIKQCYNNQAVKYGALAQLGARNIRIVEVRGSTPLCSTIKGKALND